MSTRIQWVTWGVLSIAAATYLAMSLISQPGSISRTFLPGSTTAGHYQIELRCDVCHTPGMGVRQESCLECHKQELELAKDTHPETKFNDPANAVMLEVLDARKCTTCHEEHVPDRTHPMGLSLPTDYCFRCHDDIAEVRPSHQDFGFETCASAGCHNFHDNRAIYENYLASHYGEGEILDNPTVPLRNWQAMPSTNQATQPLAAKNQDAPETVKPDAAIVSAWAASAHAKARVNCSDCHLDNDHHWHNEVRRESCQRCHDQEATGFLAGRHGMRLSLDLEPMSPAEARQPMQPDSAHRDLTCNSCHSAHDYSTATAAVDSCLECHSDKHSLAYKDSLHYELWQAEMKGQAQPGTGVSCATCHLPRVASTDDTSVRVVHNQNDNLRPNEKMIRSVCANCHGLQFTLDALAEADLVKMNFSGSPEHSIESINMAHRWLNRRKYKQEKEKD